MLRMALQSFANSDFKSTYEQDCEETKWAHVQEFEIQVKENLRATRDRTDFSKIRLLCKL